MDVLISRAADFSHFGCLIFCLKVELVGSYCYEKLFVLWYDYIFITDIRFHLYLETVITYLLIVSVFAAMHFF